LGDIRVSGVIDLNKESMITDELLFRFLHQETSQKENGIIGKWLSENPDQESRLNALREFSDYQGQAILPEELENDWKTIESRMPVKPVTVQLHPSRLTYLVRIAAVLLILVGSGLLLLYQTNIHVVRNRDLMVKSVFLPDGTQVDLGPGSKLVYEQEFMEGARMVRLTGDAYFDVTSDPEHPFTVIAGLARIKVTGTQFVVNASPVTNEVEVSVKSGIVLFYNSETMDKNSFRMGLIAGEKGIFYPALNRMDKTKDPYYQSTP